MLDTVTTRDTNFNTEIKSWLPVAEVWAEIQDVLPSRSEGVLNGTIVTSAGQTRIRVRWRRGITSSMRVRILHPDQRDLEIVAGPAEFGGNRAYLELMCEELKPGD